jgi:hypothetical protein
MRLLPKRKLLLLCLPVASALVSLSSACSECEKRPPRHEQCWWHESPRARTIDYCGELALEGAEAHEGHECGFVICVEAATADQCLGPNGRTEFDEKLLARMQQLNVEEKLGFEYDFTLESYNFECTDREPIDSRCCVIATFIENGPADGCAPDHYENTKKPLSDPWN